MSDLWPPRDWAAYQPNDQQEHARGEVSPASGRRREQKTEARPGRVLIADDSWDAREMYATYFRSVGYDAATADDGRAAIKIAMAQKPDVIVMDLAMPGMNGISAAHHLKHHPSTRRIPVILLTGHAHRAITEGALEMGIEMFLTKPCLPEDLEEHVRRLLERHTGK
jgi:CheY-like chemotaxis protein